MIAAIWNKPRMGDEPFRYRYCGLSTIEMVGTAAFPALGLLCDEITMDYADEFVPDIHGLRVNYPPLW